MKLFRVVFYSITILLGLPMIIKTLYEANYWCFLFIILTAFNVAWLSLSIKEFLKD